MAAAVGAEQDGATRALGLGDVRAAPIAFFAKRAVMGESVLNHAGSGGASSCALDDLFCTAKMGWARSQTRAKGSSGRIGRLRAVRG